MSKSSFAQPVVLMSIARNLEQEPRELFEELPRGSEVRKKSKGYESMQVPSSAEVDATRVNAKITSKVTKYRGKTLVLAHSNPKVLLAASINSNLGRTGVVPLLIDEEMSDDTKKEMAGIAAAAVNSASLLSTEMRSAIEVVQNLAKCQEFFTATGADKKFSSPIEMLETLVTRSRASNTAYDNTATSFQSFAQASENIAQRFDAINKAQNPSTSAFTEALDELFAFFPSRALVNPRYAAAADPNSYTLADDTFGPGSVVDNEEEDIFYASTDDLGVNTEDGTSATLTGTRGNAAAGMGTIRRKLATIGAQAQSLETGKETLRALADAAQEDVAPGMDLYEHEAQANVITASDFLFKELGICFAPEVDLNAIAQKFNLENNAKIEGERQKSFDYLVRLGKSAAALQIVEENPVLRSLTNDDQIIQRSGYNSHNLIFVSKENMDAALEAESARQRTTSAFDNPTYDYGTAGVAPAVAARVRGSSQQGAEAVYTLASSGKGSRQ